jgi:hypothetical protein
LSSSGVNIEKKSWILSIYLTVTPDDQGFINFEKNTKCEPLTPDPPYHPREVQYWN